MPEYGLVLNPGKRLNHFEGGGRADPVEFPIGLRTELPGLAFPFLDPEGQETELCSVLSRTGLPLHDAPSTWAALDRAEEDFGHRSISELIAVILGSSPQDRITHVA
jgi:hypothetical protein